MERGPDEIRRMAARGDLGPAFTTVIVPILLPWCCSGCSQVRPRRCAHCGAIGYTHGAHAEGDLRCLECQEWLDPIARERLRQP